MRMFQPMLFVGLGGTGCKIGRVVEERLRSEWCGPTGGALLDKLPAGSLQPYELPGFTQFLYADLAEDELSQLRPPNLSESVYERTSGRFSFQLSVDSYTDTAKLLRGLPGDISTWLPSDTSNEPRVCPLAHGAGQIPMAGRAALFASINDMYGTSSFLRPLSEAVNRIAPSSGHMATLAGTSTKSAINVFVAFSIAGGTGCGIFLDMLHLISMGLEQKNQDFRIFPLVLMPSTFAGMGAGDHGIRLNAAGALVDIARLVDHQNTGDPDTVLSLTYPHAVSGYKIPGSHVQTAMYFSATAAMSNSDMHRSVASFLLSMVTTEQDPNQREDSMSFADQFVNGTSRQGRGSTGIGRQGVSSSLAASLTVPRTTVAAVLAQHLVAQGVQAMRKPEPTETNKDAIVSFVNAAGLQPLLAFGPTSPPGTLPPETKSAVEITKALQNRQTQLDQKLVTLQTHAHRVASQIAEFDWQAGITTVLAKGIDPFRLARCWSGFPEATEGNTKSGISNLLERKQLVPPPPPGQGQLGPGIPPLSNKRLPPFALKQSDESVVRIVDAQTAWYSWRALGTWASAWSGVNTVWGLAHKNAASRINVLTNALVEGTAGEQDRFVRASTELYKKRTGSQYLLPDGGENQGLSLLYLQLCNRLRERHGLNPNATDGRILSAVLGASGWSDAHQAAVTSAQPQALYTATLAAVQTAVESELAGTEGGSSALLPRLDVLLQAMYGVTVGQTADAPQDLLDRFKNALQGLLPAGFTPDGQTKAQKALVSYPGSLSPAQAKQVLAPCFNLPAGMEADYRPAGTDSIVVTLFKSEMAITDMAEACELFTYLHAHQQLSNPEDFLQWRRRTRENEGWLLTDEPSRVAIVHSFLNVLWDGLVEVEGDPKSPTLVRIFQKSNRGAQTIDLPVGRLLEQSSWCSLVNAYEVAAIGRDRLLLQACRSFTTYQPEDLNNGGRSPSDLYRTFIDVAEAGASSIEAELPNLQPGATRQAMRIRALWAETVPSARRFSFASQDSRVANHLELWRYRGSKSDLPG